MQNTLPVSIDSVFKGFIALCLVKRVKKEIVYKGIPSETKTFIVPTE